MCGMRFYMSSMGNRSFPLVTATNHVANPVKVLYVILQNLDCFSVSLCEDVLSYNGSQLHPSMFNLDADKIPTITTLYTHM